MKRVFWLRLGTLGKIRLYATIVRMRAGKELRTAAIALVFSQFPLANGYAYVIDFGPASAIHHSDVFNNKTVTLGTEYNVSTGSPEGSIDASLFLKATIETVAISGDIGSRNRLAVESLITRDFAIRKSTPTELPLAQVKLDSSLRGIDTDSTGPADDTWSFAFASAEIIQGTDILLSVNLGGQQKKVVDTAGSDIASLAVSNLGQDIIYTLRISLTPFAFSEFDGEPSFARADFMDGLLATVSLPPGTATLIPEPSPLLFLWIGVAGVLVYRWRTCKRNTA